MGADNSTVPVTINGNIVNITPGRHTFGELKAILGVPAAKSLAVTAAVQPSTLTSHFSYFIMGGEVMTSS